LERTYQFKTKGTGPITFHLGMDCFRDEDNTLCLSLIKYIEKLMIYHEQMFGQQPKQNVSSPLEKKDHPEMDAFDLLDAKGIQMYQPMIGALQWMVTIGQLGITMAVMTMSGFRVAPRNGHLERESEYTDIYPKCVIQQFKSVLMSQIAPIYRKWITTGHDRCMWRFQN
jgi:hypothetical protein